MMQTEDGLVSTGSYPRDNLKRTQTPQGFILEKSVICTEEHCNRVLQIQLRPAR